MAPNVFISHSHSDQGLAEALVDLLLGALQLEPDTLRCTSVPGHQLPFGRTISEQLKGDLGSSSAIVVLLTSDSVRSQWVLFELGASWALGKIVVPILGRGVDVGMLPGPMAHYPSVSVASPDAASRLADAVAQISQTIGVRERTGGKREAKLRRFIELAKGWKTEARSPPREAAMAFEIPWLILMIISGNVKYVSAEIPKIKHYMSQLGIASANPIEAQLRLDDEGHAAMSLIAELGGALYVKHPHLTRLYEAGANLMPLAARDKRQEFESAVQRLPLSEELKQSRPDYLTWLNDIHDYLTLSLKQAQD